MSIQDRSTSWREASVTIGGKDISFAQSMTLRVALNHFGLWLEDIEDSDGLPQPLRHSYRERLNELLLLLHHDIGGMG